MKKTFYFSHDLNARNDVKIQKLAMETTYEGVGFFWCIVEMLYEQGGKIPLTECKSIAYALQTDMQKIEKVIDIAFDKDNKYFFSNSVLKRIKMQKEKIKKLKYAADKRWKNEAKSSNANGDAKAMQMHSKSNAIKEKKRKEKNNINNEDDDPGEIVEKISNKLNLTRSQEITFLKEFQGITTSELRGQVKACSDYMNMSSENYKNPGLFFRKWLGRYLKEKKVKESQQIETQRILDNLPVMSSEQTAGQLEKLADMRKQLRIRRMT